MAIRQIFMRALLSLIVVYLGSAHSAIAATSGAPVCYRSAAAHSCLTNADPVSACEAQLTANPFDMQARYSLCEAHLQQAQPLKAWLVLDQGKQYCGKNRQVCSRLAITLSNLEENSEKTVSDSSSLEQGRIKARHESQRRICLRPMNGDLSLNACQELLLAYPDDSKLHGALGAKLINRDRPAQAILALQKALALASDPESQANLTKAQEARTNLAKRCLAQTNLDLCNRALLVGTSDEPDLHRRRSDLLLRAGNTDAAVDALLSAQSLQPKNKDLARQLVALLPDNYLDDPSLYWPRGQARQLLQQTNGAIADLERAREAEPRNVNIRPLLQAALRDRRNTVQRRCLDKQSIAACEQVLVASAKDAPIIREHIADLKRAEAKARMAALATEIEPQAEPIDEPKQPNPSPKTTPVVAQVSYSNATAANGVTF